MRHLAGRVRLVVCLGAGLSGVAITVILFLWPASMQEPKLRAAFVGHNGIRSPVAFSPDGKTIAFGEDRDTIRVFGYGYRGDDG